MLRRPPRSTLFPTRRSSDLQAAIFGVVVTAAAAAWAFFASGRVVLRFAPPAAPAPRPRDSQRSEEHTSELQSQFHLVCRLLLEKKKKKYKTMEHSYQERVTK